MTGTAKTEEAEFEKIYKLEVTIVPTNRPNQRQDVPDVVYKTEIAKWQAIAEECASLHEEGRPILVGTTSVEKSEVLSRLLSEKEIPHELLNAKPENVERESEIVAQAGRTGALTIATNMAGRGTDIILGGNSDYMARLKVREYLMPKIVRPEEDEPMAMAQVSIPEAQQGAQGFGGEGSGKKAKSWKVTSDIFPTEISADTEAMLKAAVNVAVKQHGEQSLSELEAEEILAIAAEKAPTEDPAVLKVREVYTQIRTEYESLTSTEHDQAIQTGGLHVIGTERHESRRIDNQLRGRAGASR